MPKKPPKNAYFYFMLEYKGRQRLGHKINLKKLSEICSEPWKKLTSSQKAKYEAMAKNSKAEPGERYTSQGVSFSLIDKVKKEEEEAHNLLQSKLIDVVQSGVVQNSLETQEFIFVTFNYFCRDHLGNYIPAEIGIIKFSLQGGVQNNKLHLMINPRVLPLGSAYTAITHSNNTHRLKPPPFAVGEKNFDTIFEEIRNFINPTNDSDFPILYTMSDHIPCVGSILQQLALEICHDEKEASDMFLLCAIDDLFFRLKKNTTDPLPSHHMAKILLNTDHYEHRPGLACSFHEDEDIPKYCALAMVTRWAFTVCDNICSSLDIKLIPGKHVPLESDVNYKLIKPGDEGDPMNVWNKNKNRNLKKNEHSGRGDSDQKKPVLYETIWINGKPILQLKEEVEAPSVVLNPYARYGHISKDEKESDVDIKEEEMTDATILLENPFALSQIRPSYNLQDRNMKSTIVKNETFSEVKPVLVKRDTLTEVKPAVVRQETDFAYRRASIVENPFARKEQKFDPNSFYVKQLKEVHRESDDESDTVPRSIFEDRTGSNKIKRGILTSDSSPINKKIVKKEK